MTVYEDIEKLDKYINKLKQKYKGTFEITYPLEFMQTEVSILIKRSKDIDKQKKMKLEIKEQSYDGFNSSK